MKKLEAIIATGDTVNNQSLVIAKSSGKLNELNSLQKAHLEKVKAFWLNYIFSCKNSVNREAANIGIEWMYKLAGHEKPVIIYVDSPLAQQYAAPFLKELVKQIPPLGGKKLAQVGAQVRDQVGAQVWDQVGDQVRAQVWDQVGDQVWDQVGDQVRDQVRAQVWDQVGAQVGAQVRDQVRDQVRAQVGAQVRDQVRAQVWDQVGDQVWAQVWAQVGDQVRAQVGDQVRAQVGAQVRDQVGAQVWDQVGDQVWEYTSTCDYGSIADYGWVSFFDFFTQIGVINHEGFNKFKEVMLSGVYDMIQLNGFCIVADLPKKIIRNNAGRLHNPNGPAIEFKDGYCQHYINGRSIPNEIFDKASSLTKEQFLAESNSDYKGAWYEILGQKKMMDLLGAKEIDVKTITHLNGDIETITLLKTTDRFPEIDDQPFAWVKMICPSTGTQYLQGVEPFHTCALEAIASLSPFKKEEYSFNYRS